MSGFKLYYNLESREKIFERIFQKHYKTGYFGEIERDLIYEDQKNWFNKFVNLIEKKQMSELSVYLESRENKLSREVFDKIVGTKIKYKTSDNTILEVKNFCEGKI